MGPGRCPPKSDANPLTLPEHPCYYPHRSNTHPTISRRNHNPGGIPAPAPRTQRPSPSQRAAHTPPHGSSESRHLLIPKAPAIPSPTTQVMEGPQTMLGMPRPGPLPIQRFPLPDAFTPAHCVPVSRVGQPTPGLARPSCPCLSRRPRHPSTRRMHRDAGIFPVSGPVKCRCRWDRPHTTLTAADNMWG